MDVLSFLVGVIIGLISGIITGSFLYIKKGGKTEDKEILLRLDNLQDSNIKLIEENSRLKTENQYLKSREEEITNQIKVYANELLEKTAKSLSDSQNSRLESTIDPLNKALKEFKNKIELEKTEEVKERTSLKLELKTLMDLNQVLATEAKELTLALKGDQKTQGTWGELKLRKVLEASGLVEGEEFIEQGEGLNLKDDEGKRQLPDVVVKLPDNKHIIIDSKISLLSYEKYVNSDTEGERERHLSDHIRSLKNHINLLSEKHYHANKTLSSPEFVFLFMGLEPALIVALQKDLSIATEAWNKNIILVTPSLMLASLKSVASVWKHEKQTKNAVEIAEKAGNLYDKFVLFFEELEEVEKKLDSTKDGYSKVLNHIRYGKGNLIKRVEDIKKLGAKAKKQINPKLIDDSE